MIHEDVWHQFLTIAREEVGSRVVETWFKAIIFEEWNSTLQRVRLKAPNSFVKQWVEKNYVSLIKTHLGRLLHVHDLAIEMIDEKAVARETITPQIVEEPIKKTLIVPAKLTEIQRNYAVKRQQMFGHLNELYVFDSFVVGPNNSLAYAAAHAITEKPGALYNPLFMYGNSGLGKTHLLHAIGNEMKRKKPSAVVLYQPADRFVNEFINAIRFNKVHRFQEKYQSIDILLIDDIQFISNKEQTQEAFFHIFNSLYEAHKQIVFSSDSYPQNMKGIAERLRSRLASGLVVDLHMPSLETKVAIIKKKAALSNEILPDDVAYFIAAQVKSNVRELEGALIRVMAFASLTRQEINIELVHRVLAHTVEHKPEEPITFNGIIKSIIAHYPYTLQDLRSKGRNKELAHVRHMAMYLMKKLTDKSLRDIGNFLGGRDHSTVMHAVQRIEEALVDAPEMQARIKRIEDDINH